MALQIEWTPEANIQLKEILDYWIERNGTGDYSQKLYESIKNVLSVLSRYPESGTPTKNSFVRSKIVKKYYIFYSYDDTFLSVIGFCDMRRDPTYLKSIIE